MTVRSAGSQTAARLAPLTDLQDRNAHTSGKPFGAPVYSFMLRSSALHLHAYLRVLLSRVTRLRGKLLLVRIYIFLDTTNVRLSSGTYLLCVHPSV